MSVVSRLPKRLPSLSRMGTWGLVFAFVLTSLGLPLEEWVFAATLSAPPTACATTAGAGCQCSPARRRAGRCCCTLVKPTLTTKTAAGCCAKRTVTKPDSDKSCCASKSSPTPVKDPTGPTLTSCGCGGDESLGSLWSGDPRLVAIPVGLTFVEEPRRQFEWRDDSTLGTRPRPAVPPPRDQTLSA